MEQESSPGFFRIVLIACGCGLVVAYAVMGLGKWLGFQVNPAVVGGITGGIVATLIGGKNK